MNGDGGQYRRGDVFFYKAAMVRLASNDEQQSEESMEELEKRPGATSRRPPGLVWLHWITLVPLCLALAAVLLRGEVEDRGLRALLLWVHQCSGASVVALGMARLFVRWRLGPLQSAAAPHGSNRAAAAVHAALYVAMVAVPLLGWAFTTASGHPLPWGWGLPWVSEDEDLAERLGEWHASAAYAWLLVIGLHVGAALWHHFLLRDDVLRSMRPWRATRFSADRTPPA